MKVAVQFTSSFKIKTGVYFYTYSLVKEILRIDDKNKYTLIFPRDQLIKNTDIYSSLPKNVHVNHWIPLKLYNKLLKHNLTIPFDFLTGRHDIFFFTNFVAFPVKSGKVLNVIYDLSYIRFPSYIEKKNLQFLRKLMPKTIEETDKIITISNFSKEEIINYYKIDSEKVVVIYPAVDERFKVMGKIEVDVVKRKHNLIKPYLLFVGTIEPRKNLSNLLKAYACLKKRKEMSLLIVGVKGWDKKFSNTLSRLQLEDDVLLTGYLPDEDLPALYNGAEAFIFPSFYEGFGIPILEAFACGTPVVTSKIASIPEVAGDAALYFDPYKVDDIKDKLEKVVRDNNLKESLRKKGFDQVKKFSWERSAEKLIEVINTL